ncbi:MAG TPA: hypothetical protein LFW21_01835 [Rickettsia endosymbiont of Pyrocoelia pectoralis]|nr:hypothetical protein [Rickettsia endosymbiont of Pyrocoelia pectoralis]
MLEKLNSLDNNSVEKAEAASSWLSSLSDYLKASESLNNRVSIPPSNASNEEWHKFYSRLGLPEDKKYTDEREVEDEEYLSSYEEMFYNSGLSKRQGEKLLENLYNFSNYLQKKQEEETKNSRNTNIEWLKNHYKDEFDNKTKIMNAALTQFGTKELALLIEESNYSPALVDLLVKVGETLKSDSLVTSSEKPVILGAESALKEIKRLESDQDFMLKFKDKNHMGHGEAVVQMNQLYDIAYNNKK